MSGSGKIAMHVLEKLIAYGALPISVSGNFGFYAVCILLSFCGRQGCFHCSYVFLNRDKEITPT